MRMKIFAAAALMLALAGTARAVDYEDAEPADQLDPAQRGALLALPDTPGRALDPTLLAVARQALAGTGKWAFRFSLVQAGTAPAVMTELNADQPLIPASTMKLFTGRLAFERGLRPESYLRTMLRFSVNEMADKTLAAAGGPRALRRFIDEKGWPSDGLRVSDGSGLSAADRVTVRLETALLEEALASEDREKFLDLLARPDVDSTLKREGRLKDLSGAPGDEGRLYAKTGTLPKTGVVALAGAVELANGGTLVFSILGNALTVGKFQAREALDEVVRLHVSAASERAAAAVTALSRPRFAPRQLTAAAPRFE